MSDPIVPSDLAAFLARRTERIPGLQYAVVDPTGLVFDFAGGWADIRLQRSMTAATTMMAYSMTKTITAVAVLQLIERGECSLEDGLDRFVPDTPYRGSSVTIRQLLIHTSGIPNPIPLRWVHLSGDVNFNEETALAAALSRNPRLKSTPGARFAYSNIGYWLLGKVVERVTGCRFADHVRTAVLAPLRVDVGDLDFTIRDPAAHATRYLAKYSFMNLAKGFITDRGYWDGYDGRWLRLKNLELDGPSFGGLVGTAGGFGSFLGDQLRPGSALLGEESRRLLHTPQALDNGHPIPMTLGWHIGRPPAPITCSRRAAAAGSTARCGSTRRVASGRS